MFCFKASITMFSIAGVAFAGRYLSPRKTVNYTCTLTILSAFMTVPAPLQCKALVTHRLRRNTRPSASHSFEFFFSLTQSDAEGVPPVKYA